MSKYRIEHRYQDSGWEFLEEFSNLDVAIKQCNEYSTNSISYGMVRIIESPDNIVLGTWSAGGGPESCVWSDSMRGRIMCESGLESSLLERELEDIKEEVRRLRLAVDAVVVLIKESRGVTGLHHNGDVAPWAELLPGGRFESWLLPLGKYVKDYMP